MSVSKIKVSLDFDVLTRITKKGKTRSFFKQKSY